MSENSLLNCDLFLSSHSLCAILSAAFCNVERPVFKAGTRLFWLSPAYMTEKNGSSISSPIIEAG